MKSDDFVNGPHWLQLIFEFVEVWLQHLEQHVVEVILAELKHFMTSSIRLGKHVLNIAFFGRLVDWPGSFKGVLNIFLEEQMPENKLILVDNFLADDQTERPLNIVFESQSFIDFQTALLADTPELIGI